MSEKCQDCGLPKLKAVYYSLGCGCSFGCAGTGDDLCAERAETLSLRSQLRDLTVELAREKGQLAAALRRADAAEMALVDVRALDEWRFRGGRRSWYMVQDPGNEEIESCNLLDDIAAPGHRKHQFYGPTPEAARAKAAAWVREQATEPPDDTCPCGRRYGEYGHDH